MNLKTVWLPLLFFILVLIYYFISPDLDFFLLRCPLYQSTGIYCPGCGSQRALHNILHGEFLTALSTNLLFSIGLLASFYHVVTTQLYAAELTTHQSIFKKKYAIKIAILFVLIFWILRNLPYSGFDWLAP